ncbi:glycosyltransferase family 4 protein [Micromonas commoda]|uniref:Glycosyltransferase family 4 protein n=1 Tax=Micromonas commoda (strain RCC299 / NOUM17 / CCMP2709) TaxID=296587 RepID=C1FIS9_MICCC|nr:glycosyltransferase family 4 protein [Micromonas commoda]ACO70473.1 glycosyltransferase family 4 protein [Micromonas commoda]|eukprot:XP_002509215.1 glycosyltransferase family 4 protein [Micromonas commoda]
MGFFRRQREDDVSSAGPNGQNGSLRDPGRSVAIVTTASLPWMTGTAVNPLLRAAYLARRGLHEVTLVVPWLTPAEQRMVHPNVIFDTPEEQGEYINKWVKERCGFEPKMKLDFYPGRYATDKYSIIPVGDVSEYISDGKHDVAVLEEPEHLNWYHTGSRWSDKFRHVVGVVHTNYLEYARLEEHGAVKEAAMRFVNSWVSRVHCHKIIKLSDAVQDFPRSETVNIHGVSPVFLEPPPAPEPEKIRPSTEVFSKGCYFLGKVVWGKGFNELLRRVEEHNTSETGVTHPLKLDVFGNGEDFDDVTARAKQKGLPLKFKGRMDHASDAMHDYKVFINPSLSDVVATTTAEALAMGKYVICAKHPSNEFFSTFPNCMVYETPEQFSQCVKKALSTDPAPLSAKDRYRLSWEAATDRFLDAADIKEEQMRGPGTGLGDKLGETFFAAVHGVAAKHEKMRGVLGAGRGTGRGPKAGELGTWGGVPPQSDQPGFTSTRKKQ